MHRWFALVLCVVAIAIPRGARGAICGDARPCECGDVVEGRHRLPADLGPCAGDGLVLRGGAVLDCAGHTIRGGGDAVEGVTGAASAGIVLKGTVGALVRDCTVTGFRSGVVFRDAVRSTIVGSTAVRNGNFRDRVGYGIHLGRSRECTVMECVVRDNADEGIHVGTGSDDNALLDNEVYDNGRENLYVLSAHRTQIVSNRAGGKVSANLYLKHANGARITENRFEDRPVVVRGSASANVFTDNVFGGGLAFRAYPDWSEAATRPSRNVVRGGELGGGSVCLAFMDAVDNRVEAVTMTRCARIVGRSQQLTTNEIVGMPLERIPIDLSGGASLRLMSPLRIEVVGGAGVPVAGATIRVRRRTGDVITGPASDASGVIALELATHVVSAASLVSFTPMQMTVQADGYAPQVTELTEPLPQALTVSLEGG
jgi:parallel beta-helix repeat protein